MSTQQKNITLSRGRLSLSYQTTGDYQLDELLGFAERINPKRAFLFVSQVLGRHIPVTPNRMRQAFSDLADLIPDNLPEPILVVGMAETAVGLSAGVHQRLQTRTQGQPYPKAVLLNSTRHAQRAQLLATFSEDHSHASQHLLYLTPNDENTQTADDLAKAVLNAKTLIMVDDEASTGNTCQNMVNALRQAGLHSLEQVHLATLVDWSLNQTQTQPFEDVAFFRHHLLSGSWQWTDSPNLPAIRMPNVATTEAGSQPLLDTGNWGRLPTVNSTAGVSALFNGLQRQLMARGSSPTQLVDKKILVLGSNEFVWLPFLLAEKLQNIQQSIDEHHSKLGMVKFSALTRSPIAVHPQSAITACIEFHDNYGLGMTNFVYNVVSTEWDWVLLCIETPPDSIDPYWQSLPNVLVVSPLPHSAHPETTT